MLAGTRRRAPIAACRGPLKEARMASSKTWTMGRLAGVVGLALLLPAAGGSSTAAAPTETTAAVTAATNWLAGLDAGGYAQSWDQAGELFRNALPRDTWAQQVQAVRKPLGALQSRTLKSATAHTSLPGAPDGNYVVIEFETAYEHKRGAVETVTPQLEKDGQWRVVGYFVR
jgi:hypothetical protein